MAEIIHCVCGRALEVARTDVLESVSCPHCERELQLDVTLGSGRRRGLLTVVAGPDRVGETVLMPVSQLLTIGSGANTWLTLQDKSVASSHCALMLDPQGRLVVSGAGSSAGTTFHAEVRPDQMLRIGAFQVKFSLDTVRDPDAQAYVVPGRSSGLAAERAPRLHSVTDANPLLRGITRHRFRIARISVTAAGALLAVLHVEQVVGRESRSPYTPVGLAIALAAGLAIAASKLGLGNRGWNLAGVGVVLLAAGVELAIHKPLAMAALLILAAGLLLAVLRPPTSPSLIAAVGLMTLAVVGLLMIVARGGGASERVVQAWRHRPGPFVARTLSVQRLTAWRAIPYTGGSMTFRSQPFEASSRGVRHVGATHT